MRKKSYGTLKVRAISGTYVVFLAFDMKEADATGLMGFAIQRTRLKDGETIWLRGNKRFPSCGVTTGYEDANSHEHPFQAFQWADYSAEPGERYRYRVIPMFGQPCQLAEGPATSVTIETEPLSGPVHDVHWNRGAIASQAFVRRFPNKTLDEAGKPAYEWLARDLLPGLLAFIGQASDATFSLRAAIYEFAWPDSARRIPSGPSGRRRRRDRLPRARPTTPGRRTTTAIDAAQIRGLCKPRVNAKLMHNKFIVLLQNGAPVSVWTGSTNFSRNALHGQLNVGHVIHDAALAQQFLDYWTELRADPRRRHAQGPHRRHQPAAAGRPTPTPYTAGLLAAPRRVRSSTGGSTYANRKKPLFMTFPFGIVKDFRPGVRQERQDPALRPARQVRQRRDNARHARPRSPTSSGSGGFPNVGMALGNRIFVDWIDGWHEEGRGIGVNVNWIHTKFMLIDPLGTKPITLTGSANWSRAERHRQRREHPRDPRRQARGRHLLRRVHAPVRPSPLPRVGEAPPRRDPGFARRFVHDGIGGRRLVAPEGPVRGLEGLGARSVQARLRTRHQAPLLRGELGDTESSLWQPG